MAPAQRTQIYVTAATALRTVLGHHLSILPVGSRTQRKLRRWCTSVLWNLYSTILFLPQSYLLSCAENVGTKPVPDCLHWLFTPLGRQFFLSCDWSVKSESTCEIYTSQRDPGKLQENQMMEKFISHIFSSITDPQSSVFWGHKSNWKNNRWLSGREITFLKENLTLNYYWSQSEMQISFRCLVVSGIWISLSV